MPKRSLETIITGDKIKEILVTHAEGNPETATITVESVEKWLIHLPVVDEDGFRTAEIVEYSKREVDEILQQEARTRRKIDITGGSQSIKYSYDGQTITSCTITLHGTKR